MRRDPPFATLAPGAASHFRLTLFGTVLRLAELCAPDERPAFIADYLAECAALWGGRAAPGAAVWSAAVDRWAEHRPDLPFARLAATGSPALHRPAGQGDALASSRLPAPR